MPTDKRQRQREGREARRAAARAAQRRAARRRQIFSVIVLLALVGGIGFGISQTGSGDEEAVAADKPAERGSVACPPASGADEPRRSFPGPPKMCLNDERDYTATVTTDVGDFTIALDPKAARETVNNFVFLARYRAYEDVPFHRVIPGFVVQGGDVAMKNGQGDAGYKFADELPKAGDYKIGSVAMANSGPDTNGSQFFVITGDQGVALPPNYSLFGTVIDGMDVVKAIEADGGQDGKPTVIHKIVKVAIDEKEA